MFVRICCVSLLKKEYCVNDKLGFWFSACDVTATFPCSLSQGSSSFTIGSALRWLSNIAIKYRLMILNHGIEHTFTDIRLSVIFSVPRL